MHFFINYLIIGFLFSDMNDVEIYDRREKDENGIEIQWCSTEKGRLDRIGDQTPIFRGRIRRSSCTTHPWTICAIKRIMKKTEKDLEAKQYREIQALGDTQIQSSQYVVEYYGCITTEDFW